MLGLVATGRRSISPGTQYAKYFATSHLKGTDPVLMQNGSNHDTLARIDRIVNSTLSQTRGIANHLRGSSMAESLRNLWTFLYNHVQYKEDRPGVEQLRTPLRTWKDRTSGVDCDCFTIFIKSVLKHWDYPNASRMAGYSGDYQHVYVVVPKDGKRSSLEKRSDYFVVDPVVDRFDYEVPFTKKSDRFMNTTSGLDGLSTLGACPPPSSGGGSNNNCESLRVSYLEEEGKVVTEKLLNENGIPFTRENLSACNHRFKVETPCGPVILPAVINSQGEAATYLAAIQQAKQKKICDKPSGWGGLALVACAIALVIAPTPKESSNGFSGAPVVKTRRAPRKLKTMRI